MGCNDTGASHYGFGVDSDTTKYLSGGNKHVFYTGSTVSSNGTAVLTLDGGAGQYNLQTTSHQSKFNGLQRLRVYETLLPNIPDANSLLTNDLISLVILERH